ncbi:MAG: tetratricopeptide repeat protein [bacterium]
MSRRKLYDILGVSIFWGIPILLIIRLNFFKTGSEASKLYDSGIKKYDSENYTGAIQDFTKAIELDSGYIDAYQERGRVRYDLGDYTGAVQDYDKVIELDKKDGE